MKAAIVTTLMAALFLQAALAEEATLNTVPQAAGVPLIPREVIFGNPENVNPQLSPDGRYLAYIAPLDGVLNIWLRSANASDARALTADKGRGISEYFWAYNNEQLIYVQDGEGDENYRIYSVALDSGAVSLLTPPDPAVTHKVRAEILAGIPERPDEILIGLNNRDESTHDVYLLNLRSGAMSLLQQGDPRVMGWITDNALAIRGYTRAEADGGATLLLRPGADGEFGEWRRISAEDLFSSGPAGFSGDNKTLYLIDSSGRNSGALSSVNLETGEEKLIASDATYDVGGLQMHPTTHELQAVSFVRERREWQVLDPAVQASFDTLVAAGRGDFSVINGTLDDRSWLVSFTDDDNPVSFWRLDRDSNTLSLLFYARPGLVGQPLCEMRPISYTASDGLKIHGYLTLPQGWQGAGPLVLNVHGGPWYRDNWGYHPEAQWLANRGYACLQVNFRGSIGYGKEFVNAGDREWGGRMQQDLSDAVAWAIAEGIADPARVAIYGGSYGGYATLAGVTFTPDLYACGVSIVGPSNLLTFLNTIPPYWESFRKQMDNRVGQYPRTADGSLKPESEWTAEEQAEVEFLKSRSPLFSVERVRVPMFIAQGANDPRVKRAESEQFVEAMQAKGLEVEYVVYENEGHGFVRPENRLDYYAKAEKFLAEHLGGRYEE